MFDVHTDEHGPILDGTAGLIVSQYLDEAKEQIAQDAYDQVQQELAHVLRHPTGNYQGHIQVETRMDSRLVNDSGIVYGPWLEGVGSRNRSTRFKGYATFRRIGDAVERGAKARAEAILQRYIGRLG